MSITIDQVVAAYVSTRDEIKELEKALEEKIKPLKELQERREQYLHQQLTDAGAQNIKTKFGTVYQTRKESVTVADWDAILEWITKSEAWEFLNKAVNKTAVLECMGDERQYPPPPGVNYTAIATVNIRKS